MANYKASIKRYLPAMELLKSLPTAKQSKHLRNSPVDLIKFFADLLYNVSSGFFPIEPDVVVQLKPHKKLISKICEKKRSLKARKNLICRKGTYDKIFSPLIKPLIDLLQ